MRRCFEEGITYVDNIFVAFRDRDGQLLRSFP